MIYTFDCETIGLHHQHPDFKVLFQGWDFGNRIDQGMWWNKESGNCPPATIVGHNLKFDLKCLPWDLGPYVSYYDTAIATHFIREDLSSGGTKDACNYKLEKLVQLMGYDCPNYKNLVDFKGPYYEDMDTLRLYNKHDLWGTAFLYHKTRPILEARGQMPLFNLVMEAVRTLSEIERNGFQVDIVELDRQKGLLDQQIELSERKLKSYGDINWKSAPQVVAWFKKHKIKLPKTALGNPSASERAITEFAKTGNATAQTLLDYRGFLKQRKTYIGCAPDCTQELDEDGHEHRHGGFWSSLINNKYYPDYNMTRTVSGRYSERYGQVWPRAGTSEFKKCIVSKFPGGGLIEGDWAQLELMLIAETIAIVTGDTRMADDLDNGVDIHNGTLKTFPFIPDRTKAKNCNFLVWYMGGVAKLVREYGFTTEQATAFLHNLKVERYPGTMSWHEQVQYEVLDKRMVINCASRRRHTDNPNEAINFYIQPWGSDLNKAALVVLHKNLKAYGGQAHVVGEIHDALIVDHPAKERDDVVRIMKQSYSETIQYFTHMTGVAMRLKYRADLKEGKNLYDMKKIA